VLLGHHLSDTTGPLLTLTPPLTVEQPTLDLAAELPATITRILGGTTDCAAAPGACVVGLVRFEQDGSLTSHLVPVSFEP
jgi:hypothetical protein